MTEDERIAGSGDVCVRVGVGGNKGTPSCRAASPPVICNCWSNSWLLVQAPRFRLLSSRSQSEIMCNLNLLSSGHFSFFVLSCSDTAAGVWAEIPTLIIALTGDSCYPECHILPVNNSFKSSHIHPLLFWNFFPPRPGVTSCSWLISPAGHLPALPCGLELGCWLLAPTPVLLLDFFWTSHSLNTT